MSHLIKMCFAMIVIPVMALQSAFLCAKQRDEETMNCRNWIQRVDSTLTEGSAPVKAANTISKLTDEDVLMAIECLLKCEGNKHPGRFSGATVLNVSQLLPSASADLAALYYISFLFVGEWGHADGVALWNDKGVINPRGAIHNAYAAYRRWFKKVKAIGLAEARSQKLNPLEGTNLRWYGK